VGAMTAPGCSKQKYEINEEMALINSQRISAVVATETSGRSRALCVCIVLIVAAFNFNPKASVMAQSTQSARAPGVTATLFGSPELVSNDQSACDSLDIPDAYPRAYRDYQNNVHLISSHYVARGMVGANLDDVRHDCKVLFRSSEDPDPTHFLDKNWITSLYTEDGRTVFALMHTEYQGDTHAGMCGKQPGTVHSQDCTWTSITYAVSRDGGQSFQEPTPPKNLVAALPYPYDKNSTVGMWGFDSPTNILKLGKFYYSMINVWREYKAQKYGPCLVRTSNLLDASSWRGFDGKDFSVRFLNPYVDKDSDLDKHVCFPIIPGNLDSLAVDERTGVIVGITYVTDNRFGFGTGLYVLGSRDLIHWSKPSLVANTTDMLKLEGRGNYSYAYEALIDPVSKDRNFSTISSTPYVYYVRLDNVRAPYGRMLVRRRIKISIDQ
jgi:hypothetical protein